MILTKYTLSERATNNIIKIINYMYMLLLVYTTYTLLVTYTRISH